MVFGFGKLPSTVHSQNPLIFEENVWIANVLKNYRAPRKYSSNSTSMVKGSIALTEDWLYVYSTSSRPLISVPWSDSRHRQVSFSVQDNRLVVAHDAGLFLENTTGSITLRIKTKKAAEMYDMVQRKIWGFDNRRRTEVLPEFYRAQHPVAFEENIFLLRSWWQFSAVDRNCENKKENSLGCFVIMRDRLVILGPNSTKWVNVPWSEPRMKQISFSVEPEHDLQRGVLVDALVMSHDSRLFLPRCTGTIRLQVYLRRVHDMLQIINQRIAETTP